MQQWLDYLEAHPTGGSLDHARERARLRALAIAHSAIDALREKYHPEYSPFRLTYQDLLDHIERMAADCIAGMEGGDEGKMMKPRHAKSHEELNRERAEAELGRMEALVAAATPGPWQLLRVGGDSDVTVYGPGGVVVARKCKLADARLIAAAYQLAAGMTAAGRD